MKIKYEEGESGKHAKDCMCGQCEGKGKGKKMEGADDDKGGEREKYEALSEQISQITASLAAITKRLDTATPPATMLAFTGDDGEVVQLSAKDVFGQLQESKKIAADSKLAVEKTERKSIIEKLSSEGRVVIQEDGVAAKLEDLEKMDMGLLKFAARNAQIIPLQAKAVYSNAGNGPAKEDFKGSDGKPLTGSALTAKDWECKYGNLEKMLATPDGQLVQ